MLALKLLGVFKIHCVQLLIGKAQCKFAELCMLYLCVERGLINCRLSINKNLNM